MGLSKTTLNDTTAVRDTPNGTTEENLPPDLSSYVSCDEDDEDEEHRNQDRAEERAPPQGQSDGPNASRPRELIRLRTSRDPQAPNLAERILTEGTDHEQEGDAGVAFTMNRFAGDVLERVVRPAHQPPRVHSQ